MSDDDIMALTTTNRHLMANQDTTRRRVEVAWAQVLLDDGIPDHLQVAWRALAVLSPADRQLLVTALPRMDELLITCRFATAQILETEVLACDGCHQMFERKDLRPSPYEFAYVGYCTLCLQALDVRMADQLAKRSIRSASRRNRGSVALTEEQWKLTCKHFDDRCAYCGFMHWRVVEHSTPIALGGQTDVTNCVPACYGCNAKKGSRTLEELDGVFDAERLERVRAWLAACGRGQPARPAPAPALQTKLREATVEELDAFLNAQKKKEL